MPPCLRRSTRSGLEYNGNESDRSPFQDQDAPQAPHENDPEEEDGPPISYTIPRRGRRVKRDTYIESASEDDFPLKQHENILPRRGRRVKRNTYIESATEDDFPVEQHPQGPFNETAHTYPRSLRFHDHDADGEDTGEEELAKPGTIDVQSRDFMISIKKPVPRSTSSQATPLPTQEMAPSATSVVKSKAEMMRAEIARLQKELEDTETTARQAELEEEAERRRQEAEEASRRCEEAKREVERTEKIREAAELAKQAAEVEIAKLVKKSGAKAGSSKDRGKAVEVGNAAGGSKRSKVLVESDDESDRPSLPAKRKRLNNGKARAEGSSVVVEAVVPCIRCNISKVPCMKTSGRGQACSACSHNKQKCEGVQWVSGSSEGEIREQAREFGEFRKDFNRFSMAMTKAMEQLVITVSDMAKTDHCLGLSAKRMESRRSEGSTVTAEYSELEDTINQEGTHGCRSVAT